MNTFTEKINDIKDGAAEKIKSIDVTPETVLSQALKVPGVKIDREKFLRKELITYYSDSVVNDAIAFNPAYADIRREAIDKIAKKVIAYETNKVSAISFAAGLPGGWAMAATIPADLAQYFGFALRVMQKLAYLYGFDDFELNEDNLNDNTMNEMLIFLGVMFGVQEANAGVKVIAQMASKKVSKSLAQKALTKGAVYPIIKKIATNVGIKMTKQVFANGVAKVIPVVGGVVNGGLTFMTFRPCCNRLKKSFSELNLSDPDYFNKCNSTDVEVTE